MPELPEVETIVRALRHGGRGEPPVLGLTFIGADVLWERSVAAPEPEEFRRRIAGQKIRDIDRRGKFIIFHLNDRVLLVHLRMSGDLLVEPVSAEDGSPAPLRSHDRVILPFSSGLRLVFNDPRKFGRVWLVADPLDITRNLGPEPLDGDFTPEELFHRLQGTNRQLKPLLLDQTFLAGLGNIYTDEALHLARLHPNRPAGSLDFDQARQLWAAIRQVLETGISRNGASIDWVYRGGDFQNHFRVYQRTGQPCPVCGTLVQRQITGQRGTHFCPVCQRL